MFDGARKCAIFLFFFLLFHCMQVLLPTVFRTRKQFYLFFYVLKLSALARRVKWPVCLAIMIFQPRPQPAMAQRAGRVSNETDKQRAGRGTRRALGRVSV